MKQQLVDASADNQKKKKLVKRWCSKKARKKEGLVVRLCVRVGVSAILFYY
jgi:hypothetical protein